MRKISVRFLVNIAAALLILLSVVSVLQGIRNALGTPLGSFDFQYDSALLMRLRINPYDESLTPTGVTYKLGLFDYYGELAANQFPSLLAILIPLTYLKPYTANVVWVIINLLLTIVIIDLSRRLFFKETGIKGFVILVCCLLAGTCWRNNIGNGQHTIFAFAFYLIALWLSESKKTVLSGMALAFSYFKYTLTVPLALYFIYKRRYKELAVSIAIHVIATPICAWWLKDSIVNMIKKPLEISSSLSSSGFIDLGSILNLESSTSMVFAVSVCVLMLALSVLRSEKDEYLFFSILTYISLIIIYHSTYDFFVLVIPLGIFSTRRMKDLKGDKVAAINMLLSILIFIYVNFIQKIIVILDSRVNIIHTLTPYITTTYAVVVYAFVIYLVVQYLHN